MYKLIKVAYNDSNKFILDIINKYDIDKETYDLDYHKERSKAIMLLRRNGTMNTPLIEFIDEGGNNSNKVLWSETTKDWETELDKFLIKLK